MPLTYMRAVKVTVVSVLLSGLVHILGHSQVAGYMLLAIGGIGMVVTLGSAMEYIKIIGRDGRVIPPMTWASDLKTYVSLDKVMLSIGAGMLTTTDDGAFPFDRYRPSLSRTKSMTVECDQSLSPTYAAVPICTYMARASTGTMGRLRDFNGRRLSPMLMCLNSQKGASINIDTRSTPSSPRY
jgi:hypothetical protein